jgi:zinc protease
LLRLALTQPRFDREPVERIRQQILIGLKRDEESPHAIAAKRLFETLFPDHPYGRPPDGTAVSVSSITVDDLKAFMKRRIGLDNLIIGVVGDISKKDMATTLDKTFGSLPEKSAPWKLTDTRPVAKGQTIVIDKAVPQSAILFAEQGLKRNDPDYYTAFVMNHIFGAGSFTSRLYQEVREKRGLVYSVGTSLYPFDASALIFGSAGTANKRVGETLAVLKEEWEKMATNGVTEKELNNAKTYLTGSFPLRFSSSGRIASILVGMQLSDLGIDYLDKRNAIINAVTLKDIHRVAAKLLKFNNLVTVIVGQPDGISSTN